MKFTLGDGTFAILNGIVQTRDYRRDYLEIPVDAVNEVMRIAKMHLSGECWMVAPMLFIGENNENLGEMMRRKHLPPILCIGEFLSYRKQEKRLDVATFLHVVWLQDEFLPYMSASNEMLFTKIMWDQYVRKT